MKASRFNQLQSYFLLIQQIRKNLNDCELSKPAYWAESFGNSLYNMNADSRSLTEKIDDLLKVTTELKTNNDHRLIIKAHLKPTLSELKEFVVLDWIKQWAEGHDFMIKSSDLNSFGKAVMNRAFKNGYVRRYKMGKAFTWANVELHALAGSEG